MKNVRSILCAGLLFGLCLSLIATAEETTKPLATPLSQEQLEAIAVQPATNWKQTAHVVPEMLPLFKEESINIDGTTLNYRLHVPEKLEEGKKYPLVLWLHGAGEAGSDNKLQLVHLHHIITSLTGEKKRDFFLLVPQYPHNTSWSMPNTLSYISMTHVPPAIAEDQEKLEKFKKDLQEQTKAASSADAVVEIKAEAMEEMQVIERRNVGGVLGMFGRTEAVTRTETPMILRVTVTDTTTTKDHPLDFAFAMVEQALEKYPVDKDRITVSGLSTGGDGTWRALERRPDLFAAGVPLVSWSALTDAAMEQSPVLKKIPIWAIYSSDDRGIDRAREDFERVEKAGANVKKTEFGICGHSAWTPAMLQADIFAWLLSRGKKGDEYIQIYDPGVNPDDMKGIVDVATRDPGKPTMAPAVAPQPETVASFQMVPATVPAPTTAQTRAEQRQHIVAAITQRMPTMPTVTATKVNPETDNAYSALAERYFVQWQAQQRQSQQARQQEAETGNDAGSAFRNCVEKISPKARIRLIERLHPQAHSVESVRMLEEILDAVSMSGGAVSGDAGMPQPGRPPMGIVPPIGVIPPGTVIRHVDDPVPAVPVAISAERIIEECNRPWAMTSESLYGMFPADWGKEAEAIPEFIVNSDTEALAKKLAQSVGSDPESKDFVAACRSMLLLTNKPMSSPWFETSGGRLRSEIQYSLSPKGQMFVRFLRTVKDSAGNSDKARELSKVAEKTLEKIDLVLAK